jgi:hypothetical protein
MKWTHVKRLWDVLKNKIGQFWDYLSGRSYPIPRLIPARAARRQPRARAPGKKAEMSPLDPNRFQLD